MGTHTVTVSAVDEVGARTEQSAVITVASGAGRPVAEILSPTPDQFVAPNTVLTFAATASDPEDGALPPERIEWVSDRDGLLGTGPTIQSALSAAPNPCNHRRHTITLRLTDSHGNVTEYTIVVRVSLTC